MRQDATFRDWVDFLAAPKADQVFGQGHQAKKPSASGSGSAGKPATRRQPGLQSLEQRMLLSAESVVLGDYDGNGFVSQSDLDLVLLNWGDNPVGDGTAVPAGWVNDLPVDTISQNELDGVLLNWGRAVPRDFLVGDYDDNGVVSQSDLDLVLLNWGSNTTPAGWTNDLPLDAISQNELDGVLLNWGKTASEEPVEGRAFELTSGQTVHAALETTGDVDTFTIDAAAGDTLFLNFSEAVVSNNFDPGIFIFNPDGSILSSVRDTSNGASFSDLALSQTGTYTIVVRDYLSNFTGDYALTAVVVDDVIDADNVALTSGQTVTYDLAIGDIDTFTIGASAGDTLFLNFSEDVVSNNFDPGIYIYSPDGTRLSFVRDDSTGTSFSDLSLTQTGTYTVVVRDYLGNYWGEDYTLTAVVVDDVIDVDNVALSSGQTVTYDLAIGDIDTFTIGASAGDTLFLNFSESVVSNNFDPGIYIYSPDGTRLSFVRDDSTGTSFSDLSLTQTGTYTVVVRDYLGNYWGEDYTLTAVVVDDVIDVDNVALSSGQTVTYDLAIGDIDTFTIGASAGDTLFLNFSESVVSNNFDPGIYIYSPDGTRLSFVRDDSTGTSFSDLSLTQTGTYTVVVRDYLGNYWGEDYTLTAVVVDDVIDADNVALSSGQTVTYDLAIGDIDTFTIGASAGDTLFLDFSESVVNNNFDPGVYIYNPDGTRLTFVRNDSNGLTFSDLFLTQTGTYTIVIRDYLGNYWGEDYMLTVDILPPLLVNSTFDSTSRFAYSQAQREDVPQQQIQQAQTQQQQVQRQQTQRQFQQ